MNLESQDSKIVDALLFLIVLTLCFNNVHVLDRFPHAKIVGPYGQSLFWFPLASALVYTAWCVVRRRIRLAPLLPFAAYAFVLLAVGGVSTWLNRGTVVVESGLLGFELWQFKTFALDVFWSLWAVYFIYLWYRGRWRRALELAALAVGIMTVVVILVALIEVVGECGNDGATKIAYSVECLASGEWVGAGDEMPLRLYLGRIQSIFPEPSFLGIWAAGALPILLARQWNGGFRWHVLTMGLMTLMICSCSRLAQLSLGVILLSYLVIAALATRTWRKVLVMIAEIIVSTILAVAIVSNFKTSFIESLSVAEAAPKQEQPEREQPVSAVGEDVSVYVTGGGMATRLKNCEVELRAFRKHLAFGCGYMKIGMTFGDYLKDEERRQFAEIDEWMCYQENVGPLVYQVPSFSTVTRVLAEFGLVGAVVVFLPMLLIGLLLVRRFVRDCSVESGLLIVFLLGIATTFVGWYVLLFLWIFLALGLSLAYLGGDKECR